MVNFTCAPPPFRILSPLRIKSHSPPIMPVTSKLKVKSKLKQKVKSLSFIKANVKSLTIFHTASGPYSWSPFNFHLHQPLTNKCYVWQLRNTKQSFARDPQKTWWALADWHPTSWSVICNFSLTPFNLGLFKFGFVDSAHHRRRVISARGALVPPPDLSLNLLCATPAQNLFTIVYCGPSPAFKNPPEEYGAHLQLRSHARACEELLWR